VFEVISVSGKDARSFLQGQLTQDVGRLGEVPALLAAWCNPQGRVVTVMRMIDAGGPGNEIALALPAGLAAIVVERLLKFRFRASVDLVSATGAWRAFAISGNDDIETLGKSGLLPQGNGQAAVCARGVVAVDTGALPRCIEVWGTAAALQKTGLVFRRPFSDTDWRLALINAGIPTIEAATTEKFTPHMLNLDCLGAISFNKGCYTGQEVVARTEYLGSSKRRLMHFCLDVPGAAAGQKLSYNDREIGEVVNAAGQHLLAVVPVELHGKDLSLDGRVASPVELPYALPPLRVRD
jgi:hypothetical protein